MHKQYGIVLKSFFPYKMKLVLLDGQLGKIETIVSSAYACGALLAYYTQERGQLYLMHGVEIVDMPLAVAADDILFLHHVLEIVYFCAPYHGCADQTFELLKQLYCHTYIPYNYEFKIAFLFKLLMILGMHPEQPLFQDAYYYLLGQESVDSIMTKSIQLDTKQTLDAWVHSCLEAHPLIHAFKTRHFLDTKRLP